MAPVIRVGLIGHGTVGGAYLRALLDEAPRIRARTGITLIAEGVAVRDIARLRPRVSHLVPVHGGGETLASRDDLDVLVEASGASEASAWIRHALARGASVVTANKRAVAGDDVLLAALARGDRRLRCEAAVAAAVPVVRALTESLEGERVLSLRGVINGTTTFVLSRAEQGASLDEALAEAREAGYAEADPSADISGDDAASKLAILATLAWRTPFGRTHVRTRGIDARVIDDARAAFTIGKRVRLVASAQLDPVTQRVQATVLPVALEADDPLARSSGVQNVIEVRCARAGALTWFGAGAGGDHTASALLADTIAAARDIVNARPERIAS